MGETTEAMLKKLVFGLVGTLATVTVKYLANLNDSMQAVKLELSQIHQTVSSHDRGINTIDNLTQSIYRIESKQEINTNRLDQLERKEGRK